MKSKKVMRQIFSSKYMLVKFDRWKTNLLREKTKRNQMKWTRWFIGNILEHVYKLLSNLECEFE